MSDRLVFSMTDASQVGVARRAGSTLGRKLGFDEPADAFAAAHEGARSLDERSRVTA